VAKDARTYFFSYSRADSEAVLKLATELRAAGADLWLDQLDIVGGQHWDTEVESALTRCDGVLAVLSPEAIASKNVMDEVSYALERDKLIIPVLLRTCDIPFRLRRVHHVDFTGDYQQALSHLKRAIGIDPIAPSQENETAETPGAESATRVSKQTPAEPPRMRSLKALWILAGAAVVGVAISLVVYQPWKPSSRESTLVEAERPAKVEETTPEPVEKEPEEPEVTPMDRGMVTLTDINVREGPGTEYDKLTTLSRGVVVKVTGHVEDWFRVALDGGLKGYVFKELLGEGETMAARKVSAGAAKTLQPGDTFRDCDACPEMVVVPAGRFLMGSPTDEPERYDDEGPVPYDVRISEPFAVGVDEVTFAEWDACAEAGGCNGYRPDDGGWGRNRRPVVNVNWNDARAYADWLSKKTGEDYRLLTEAEWEYVARAGTETRYSFGDTIAEKDANFGGRVGRTTEVGSYPANPWKLHDVHGNVWEWVADCYEKDGYKSNKDYPSVLGSWQSSCDRVLRGGSWDSDPWDLRSAGRNWDNPDYRYNVLGFRVARTL